MKPVYVTKYALSTGIIRCDKGEMIDDGKYFKSGHYWCSRNEYALTYAEAQDRAREMAVAKIKSLEKQIKKLSVIALNGAKDMTP